MGIGSGSMQEKKKNKNKTVSCQCNERSMYKVEKNGLLCISGRDGEGMFMGSFKKKCLNRRVGKRNMPSQFLSSLPHIVLRHIVDPRLMFVDMNDPVL